MAPSLAKANPHLRDPALRRQGVVRSVATSSAIEGIRAPFKKSADTRKIAAKPVTRAKP
mgnify:FL=1